MIKCINILILIMNSIIFTNVVKAENFVSVNDKFKLHSGDLMPLFGFGTYLVKGDDIIFNDIDNALGAGYRLIDTAQLYMNEESIGKALKVLLPKYNLTRKDLFITSKLGPYNLGQNVSQQIESSIKNLDCEYLDLYLIHFPGLIYRDKNPDPKTDAVLRDETWKVFTEAVKKGLLRNIGVSNYNVKQLQELINNDHGIKPAVNQVQWNPMYYQQELLELCRKEGILLQAWASLGGTGRTAQFLENPEIKKIADKLKKTPAQVLLRWPLQQGIGIIPKASSKARIEENKDLDFNIPEEDMKILGSFEQMQAEPDWDRDTIV